MTSKEFHVACRLAFDPAVDLSDMDDRALDGCGLPDFEPVLITLAQVAKALRWHACCLNGSIDQKGLAEMKYYLVTARRARIVQSAESDQKLLSALTARLLCVQMP